MEDIKVVLVMVMMAGGMRGWGVKARVLAAG